jgi:hypothetical protein
MSYKPIWDERDALKIAGVEVNDAAIADGKVLAYDVGTTKLVYVDQGAGGTPDLDEVAAEGATTDVELVLEAGATLGVNGADGTAAQLTLCDGANPGTTETLTYAKWNSLNDTNGIVKCNGSGTFSAASAGTDYAAAANGVTNGDSHDHSGGDGAQIAYSSLSGLPTVPTQENIEDYVGAMFSGNTETGITVTYQDADGTIDLVVDSASTTTKGIIEIATAAEITAGSDTARAITPGYLASADPLIMGIESKGAGIDHGMTDIEETDTYGRIKDFSATYGGYEFKGLTESEVAVRLTGYATTEDTGTTTTADAVIELHAAKKSGTGPAALGATGNLLVVNNYTSTKLIVKGDGDLYIDGTFETYDTEDDLALIEAAKHQGPGWDKAHTVARQRLNKLGIIVEDPEGEATWVSVGKMNALQMGAISKLAKQVETQTQTVANKNQEIASLQAQLDALTARMEKIEGKK